MRFRGRSVSSDQSNTVTFHIWQLISMVTCAKLQQSCQSSLYRELSELIREKSILPAQAPTNRSHFLTSPFLTYLITLILCSLSYYFYAHEGGSIGCNLLFYYQSCLPESWLHIWLEHRLQLRAAASATSSERKGRSGDIFLQLLVFFKTLRWNFSRVASIFEELRVSCASEHRYTREVLCPALFHIFFRRVYFPFSPWWVYWMDDCKCPWTWPLRARLLFGCLCFSFNHMPGNAISVKK